MHNLQFDLAVERIDIEPWIIEKINMRTAAYMLAIGRVAEAKRNLFIISILLKIDRKIEDLAAQPRRNGKCRADSLIQK